MIPRTVPQAAAAARIHGLPVDPLTYGIAIGCPICQNGQWVILIEDHGQLSTATAGCNGCHSQGYEIALGLAEPVPAATPTRPAKQRAQSHPTITPPRIYAPR